MKLIVAFLALTVIAAGCSSPAPEASTTPQADKGPLPPGGVSGNSGTEIAPMTPTVTPNAPVSGGTSLGDGGGSVGIAAKSRAKDVAGNAGSGSLGNKPADPDNYDEDDDQ